MPTHEITLDLLKETQLIPEEIIMRVGEGGTQTVIAHVTEGGAKHTIEEGWTPTLCLLTAAGNTKTQAGSASDDTVTITLADEMLTDEGTCALAYFKLTGPDAENATTEGFKLRIEGSTTTGDAVRSWDGQLDALIREFELQVEMVKAQEAERVANELLRQGYEGLRQSQEAGRANAEGQRQGNERTREDNEGARMKAEGERAEAEATRAGNETVRGTAEDARREAETKREEAEAARKAAEDAREEAERLRKAAEDARWEAEEARKKAENQRWEAEEARKAAEAERGEAEKGRVADEQTRKTQEAGRVDAEASRVGAEGDREAAEAERSDAEDARASEESERQSAEDARVAADLDREARQQANDEAQDKNDADQAANNLAAQGRLTTILEPGQYDPETRIPTVEGDLTHVFCVPTAETEAARQALAEARRQLAAAQGDAAGEAPGFDGQVQQAQQALAEAVAAAEAANRYTEWLWLLDAEGQGYWEMYGSGGTVILDPVTTEEIDSMWAGTSVETKHVMFSTSASYNVSKIRTAISDQATAQKATDDKQDAAIAAAAKTSEKLGTADVGDATHAIYLAEGVPTQVDKVASAAAADTATSADTAASAEKLGTLTVGSKTVPVYFEDGVPKEGGVAIAVVTTEAAGLIEKLPGDENKFFNGAGEWVEVQTEARLPDPRALKALIQSATSKKDAAKVKGGGDYEFGTQVTTQEALDTFGAAIEAAQAVVDEYYSQSELDDAQATLQAAIEAFEAACTPLAADKSGFTAQETRYSGLKEGVTTSADGKDVPFGSKWVTPGDQSTADTALETARAAVNAATKQSEITAAVATLKAAIDTYESAIKTATANTTALDAAIAAANAAKEGVSASDTEGSDLPGGSKYVTTAQMKALTDAIAAATAAKTSAKTQAEIDSATSTLTAATETFKGQVKTNLPAVPSDQTGFNAMSWADLAALSADCGKSGTTNYTKLLGMTKDVAVTGVGTVKARLIGLNHDTYAAGGTAGFTFQLTDGLDPSKPVSFQMNTSNTNSGGWASSAMRSTNLPKLKAALPSDLQGVIKKVTKKTSTANSGTAVSDTEDDLFLLSLIESIGTEKTNYSDNPIASGNYLNFEGTQYEYYAAHPTKNDHIIKNASGSANLWWLRSVLLSGTTYFYRMYTDGDWSYGNASSSYLPAAGFCL